MSAIVFTKVIWSESKKLAKTSTTNVTQVK